MFCLLVLIQTTHVFAQDQPSRIIAHHQIPDGQIEPIRQLECVAYGNGIFVAVGVGLTIMTSVDGSHWVNRSSEITNNIANINFSTETYAVGGDELTIALTDKSPAELPAPNSPMCLHAVVFGNGDFVAVGDSGEILASPNGEHWAAPITGLSVRLNAIAWGNPCFVAVGDGGKILTSLNGLTWTPINSGTMENLLGVAYGNGLFTAVGEGGVILTSGNGKEWNSQLEDGGVTMTTIAFGNGIFMASSKTTQNSGGLKWQTLTSIDGKAWNEVALPGASDSVLFGHPNDPRIVYGFSYRIAQSFGGGLFFATTSKGIYTSSNGDSWNPSAEPRWSRSGCTSVAFGNGIYVAVGTIQATVSNRFLTIFGHGLATSTDGHLWVSQYTPPSRLIWGTLINERTFHEMLNPFEIHNGVSFPTLLNSQDGITWTAPNKTLITGRVCGNIVVNYFRNKYPNGVVLYSEDGISWKRLLPRYSDQQKPLVAASNTKLLAESYNGVLIELNGQPYKLNLAANFGQSMEIQASTNLVDWESLTTITNNGGVLKYIDMDVTNYPMRFYRLKLQ